MMSLTFNNYHSLFLVMVWITYIQYKHQRCRNWKGAPAEYPATIVQNSTCAHIFKERDMCRNKLTQVAGYSAVKPLEINAREDGSLFLKTDFFSILQTIISFTAVSQDLKRGRPKCAIGPTREQFIRQHMKNKTVS